MAIDQAFASTDNRSVSDRTSVPDADKLDLAQAKVQHLNPIQSLKADKMQQAGQQRLDTTVQEQIFDDQPYQLAILDAMEAKPEEIRPLVALTPDSPLATVRGDFVLLGSIHHFPKIYPVGQAVILPVTAWTFTDKEFLSWLNSPEHELPAGQEIWRLKQLLGLSPREFYTHITFYWVNLKDVIRPATCIDPNQPVEQVSLNQTVPDLYREWYQEHIVEAYSDQLYPWTRLGYTYDWGKQDDAYGLTEFLIHKGSTVYVVDTVPLLDFLQHPYLPSALPQADLLYTKISAKDYALTCPLQDACQKKNQSIPVINKVQSPICIQQPESLVQAEPSLVSTKQPLASTKQNLIASAPLSHSSTIEQVCDNLSQASRYTEIPLKSRLDLGPNNSLLD